MTFVEYVNMLNDGDRVIETERNCFYGRCGTIYHNQLGYVCVRWDKREGEKGHMGTGITEGSRKISDVLKCFVDVVEN